MKIDAKKSKALSIISICAIFLMVSFLIYKYSLAEFASDYPAHIKQSLKGEGYSLVSVIIIFFCGLLNSKIAFSLFMALVIITTVFVCSTFINRTTKLMNVISNKNTVLIVSITSLFICKICIPEWSDLYYKGSLSTQCWHNSTYTLMKPFALMSLYMFFKIQKNYLKKINIKDCILFTIVLLLTNFSKPSFILAFAPVMLAVLIKDFILTKTKSFKNALVFGCCVLISCLILVFIYGKAFGSASNGENTMAFSITNFINYFIVNKKYPLYFVLSFAYPIYITLLTIKERKQIDKYSMLIFIEVWSMYIVSFLESLLLVEVGPRAADGNFGWGSQFFAYALFIICICMQIKLQKEDNITTDENTISNYTYLLHIVFGIFYFVLLIMGYNYYF